MGRPIKKAFLGHPSGKGKQLTLQYVWLEDSEGPEAGFYIIRQVGTGRYLVSNGARKGVVSLVDGLPTAAGEAVAIVYPYNYEGVEYARKIHNRTVVTWSGDSFKWSTVAASAEGEADLSFEIWTDPFDQIEAPTEAIGMFNDNMDTDDLFAAIEEALAADNPTLFFTEYSYASYTRIEGPNANNINNRKKAAINGVKKWIELYGEFRTEEEFIRAMELHTSTEYHKSRVIYRLDDATTAAEFEEAVRYYLPDVVNDRQAMIAQLIEDGLDTTLEHAEELEGEIFTTQLKAIVDILNNESLDLTDEFAELFAYRQGLTYGKFFGFARLQEGFALAFATHLA